ncbi:Kinase suppressor of Ras 2 isoform 3 [Schistosoma japonicum]|uniref:Kinase suppressor of Ras 2 isoform 3 n=1 Tax=Schistosoma japonicum TaxID=6182 RepID=A0A4Z2DIY7_SCHJA|nr:Kinase suppressor of Ras 2 isoform 3 [Schistosoma japonicum]
MLSEPTSPYAFCKDLQNLIIVTEEQVISPLRKELKRNDDHSEILSLEIQDAENKTFEYLAQQISAICNADEDTANAILREYPKSEVCFRCLGINEDTIQGLLRIRGIGFLQLLDMPDDEVRTILQNYGDYGEEVDHVLAGLAKIRGNIDLIESDLAFEDDTRNVIKLIMRLSEDDSQVEELSSVFNVQTFGERKDSRIPPLYVTGPEDSPFVNNETSVQNSSHKSNKAVVSSNLVGHDISRGNFVGHSTNSGNIISFRAGCYTSCNGCSSLTSPHASSCITINNPQYVANKPYSGRMCGADFKTFNLFPGISDSNIPSEIDMHNGGLSVPSTPISHKISSATLSPASLFRAGFYTLPNEAISLSSIGRRVGNHSSRDREHQTRQSGTPPPKHRIKFPSPLHRSKSHESNLANRIILSVLPNAPPLYQETNPTCISRPQLSLCNTISPEACNNSHNDYFNYSDCINVNRSSITTAQHSVCPNSDVISCGNNKINSAFYHSGSMNDSTTTLVTSPRTYAHGRRVSCEYRPSKTNVQPLMTSSADSDNLLGVLNVPTNSGGATFVLSASGFLHKFELESKFGDFVKGTPCAVCNNRMRFRLQHCAYCKIKVHKSCVSHSRRLPCTGPTGGQNNELHELKGSPNTPHRLHTNMLLASQTNLRPAHSTPAFQSSDSNSASSCTSSTPGSPFVSGTSFANTTLAASCYTRLDNSSSINCGSCAIANVGSTSQMINPLSSPPPKTFGNSYVCSHSNTTSHLSSPVSMHSYGANSQQQQPHSPRHSGACFNHFEFPSVNHPLLDNQLSDGHSNNISNNNNALINTVSSGESERTVVDNAVRRLESMDSQDESSLMRTNSISVTLKEWDIPMESLFIGEIIGRGTFGTVYRGKWHGEVAIKRIDFDPEDADDSIRVEAFKREVALLHKTRHENLVLFMGACMKAPDLAIVTQLSRGETLYHLIHDRDNILPINRTISIASQIAKGMGYLHAKGIVHRDLKTRNLFLEDNSRVVIGDFGVFNFVRLCKKAKWGNYLNVPPFWLCYVSPEIIHALNIGYVLATTTNELPLTTSSDVFAFGYVN